jgi:exodeoxyribonuclease VII large subunit
MSQLSFLSGRERTWSVSELTRYLRQLIESDYRMKDLWVAGEVSNLSRPASGHLYFTLKDAGASLRCVMWRAEVLQLLEIPREGEALEVYGHIGVYEAGGQLQLYADTLRPAGEGRLYREFLQLKSRLEKEGMFDPARKRPLPAWPARIGVVTSPSAAALRDVVHVLQRRFPVAEVVLAPTPVQGEDAPRGIVAALRALPWAHPDVVLLVRGGGSLEDLAAFNDESVARAIAASAVPVVTGVGHETDFTIADFVSDRRAPTPSAAAEIATPDRGELLEGIRSARRAMGSLMNRRFAERKADVDRMRVALLRLSPRSLVAGVRQRLDELQGRSLRALRSQLRLRQAAIDGLAQTLRVVGPAAVLARGYAVVRHTPKGGVVKSVSEVDVGDRLDVLLHDGQFTAVAGEKRG